MRKESKIQNNVAMANVQGYHQGGGYGEGYAFAGFKCNKYFRSDRAMKLNDNFERPDGFPLQGYGLEIETECSSISNQTVLAEVYDKIIFKLFPADLFKMQRDASLGGRTSAECITQVMTKAFIRNHYKDFKTMFNTYFPAFGISADSFHTSCGMHVNISVACFGDTTEQAHEAIRKLFYIVNKHYSIMLPLFYRDPSRTHWCGQMHYQNARYMNLNNQPNDHTKCMNLSHINAGRVEIRLVGGQKNYACFRNTMESIFHLVDRVKTLSWDDCNNLVKLFKGCNQYVFDRLTICGLDETTLEEIKQTVKTEELL